MTIYRGDPAMIRNMVVTALIGMDSWKNENGQWKLARVISYDHQLAA